MLLEAVSDKRRPSSRNTAAATCCNSMFVEEALSDGTVLIVFVDDMVPLLKVKPTKRKD
jgi:hypothetical protein